MTIRMKNLERLTLDEMQEFVRTNRQVAWSTEERDSACREPERGKTSGSLHL